MEASRMKERLFRSADTLHKEFGHSNDDVKDLGDDASFPLQTLDVLKGTHPEDRRRPALA
jgi:hypothetical protein